MRITLSAITSRKKPRLLDDALAEYTSRLAHYATIEQQQFLTEPAFTASLQKPGRAPAKLILLDAGGRAMSSKQFAAWIGREQIGRERDSGARHLHFAIRRRKPASAQISCSPSAP